MKSFLYLISFLVVACNALHAQDSTANTSVVKYRVGIFAPLYLDSAFDASNEYRYPKTVFPKFINAGLEFYEGAQLALDSLSKEGAEVEVFIYDTRSTKETLIEELKRSDADGVDLIIAHCAANEVRQFSEAGLRRGIPVINPTIPNDGGTNGNPYFVILNPTLKTQCEGIYKFVQKHYPLDQVIMFRTKGASEDQIKTIFEEYGKATMGSQLKIKYVDLVDSFTVNNLRSVMDSTRHTICIAGSLDLNFGRRLAFQLASIGKQYPVAVVGMPTWEGIREFNKPEFKGLEIIFSNPFYNAKTDHVSMEITNHFNTVMYSRPSDMVFRGYEVTWKFVKLLMQYGKDIASNLGNKQYKVFTDYDIQPVISRNTTTLQYFENKRVYFIKWQDGLVKAVY